MKSPLLCGVVLLGHFASLHANEPTTLPPLHIESAPADQQPPTSPSLQAGLFDGHQELSKTLTTLPGVCMRALGGHAGEPVIRGLGWERVDTQYNGLNLYGACPSRMDPPLNLFSANSMDTVEVEFGPASVTKGPLPIGGRILLENHLDLAPGDGPLHSVQASGSASTVGDSYATGIQAEHATASSAFRIEGSIESSGDYDSGDGTTVQANRDSEKAAAFWTQRLSDHVLLELGTRWIYDTDVDYIALPMDSRYAKTNITTGQLTWSPEGDFLKEVQFRTGLGEVEHLMDNQDKANRRMVEAFTPSTAESSHAALETNWKIDSGELRVGIDGSRLERDALRNRTMVMMNRTFLDPIWPDLTQEQIGVFAEWERPIGTQTQLRAGLRADWFEQDAGKADQRIVPGPGVGPTTVKDAWVDVGGSEPGVVQTEDTPVSANLALQHTLESDWMLQLGLSRVEAVPNLTQRYLSFGPVPGGFGVGNPSLDMETKWELELRTEGSVGAHRMGAAVFAARVEEYLLPTTVAMLDVNGDGRIDRVRGTKNADAELFGAEASALIVCSDSLTLPVSLGIVRGEVADTGTPLPEIPPLDLRAALRWEQGESHPWFIEFGGQFAARQDRIDPEFGEDETPSYALFHLKGGWTFAEGWRIEAGIENLFDREYHDHLTREVLLPEGDLKAGDEVPGPGRGFHLALQADW